MNIDDLVEIYLKHEKMVRIKGDELGLYARKEESLENR